MEARQGSKKRKRPSASDPFMGIFTRSKSQFYLHRNRSGRARSDVARKSHHHHLHAQLHFLQRPRKKPRSLFSQEEPFDNDEMSRISIKDLRARRVFSPSSVIDECFVEKDNGIGEYSDALKCSKSEDLEKPGTGVPQNFDDGNSDSCLIMEGSCGGEDGEIDAYSDDLTPSNAGETEQFGVEFSCNAQNVNDANPLLFPIKDDKCFNEDDDIGSHSDIGKSSEIGEMEKSNHGLRSKAPISDQMNPTSSDAVRNIGVSDAEQRSDEFGEIPNGFDNSTQVCVQSTPPDDIFDKPEVGESRRNREECPWQSSDHVLGNLSNGRTESNYICINSGSHTKRGRRNDCISKNKLVLNPCSRLKVFKTSSFSYRRLLPYLMDIATDNSCSSKNGQCPKLERDLEEKTFKPSMASQCQEIFTSKCETGGFPREHNAGDSESLPTIILTTANGSCNDNEANLTSSEHITESPLSFDLQKNCASQVEQFISDQPEKMDFAHDNVKPIHRTDTSFASLSSLSPEASSREENGAMEFSHHSSVEVEENCFTPTVGFTTDTKPTDAVYLARNTSQVEALVPSEVPVAGFSKGILKRNPRGCRGLCTCLNCASFRLHAERTFEFSRNQMQDAEEVALDLIKELAKLRNMLEKSAHSAKNHAASRVNEVKEACRKASMTEELAKNRLSQMNGDLNIHCRITCLERPRVKFADYVEKRFIPKAELPNPISPKE